MIKYRDTILYDKRRRSAGTCQGKASSKKLVRNQAKVDSLHKYYSDRIERNDIRREKRQARLRTMTR